MSAISLHLMKLSALQLANVIMQSSAAHFVRLCDVEWRPTDQIFDEYEVPQCILIFAPNLQM
jgi:hypothetical protein